MGTGTEWGPAGGVGAENRLVWWQQTGLQWQWEWAVSRKASFSSAGEGLKCQTEIGALCKGDPSKASEQDWNRAKPGFRKIRVVVAKAREPGCKPNARWRLCVNDEG